MPLAGWLLATDPVRRGGVTAAAAAAATTAHAPTAEVCCQAHRWQLLRNLPQLLRQASRRVRVVANPAAIDSAAVAVAVDVVHASL